MHPDAHSTRHSQKEMKARTMSERHNFSIMVVAVGNLVHHDHSLMEVYTTPLLVGVHDGCIGVLGVLTSRTSACKSSATLTKPISLRM
jgi:hypothetical protein